MQTNSLTSPATPEPEKKKPKAKPEKGNLRLFPVSQAFQLFYDFQQSLKPPCIVGYSRAIFRVERIFAVLFGEFSYFLSQLFDTICDESRHYNLPVSCRESSLSGVAVAAESLWNCFGGDGPQVAYVVTNSGLQLRQDDFEFGLGLGGSGLRRKGRGLALLAWTT